MKVNGCRMNNSMSWLINFTIYVVALSTLCAAATAPENLIPTERPEYTLQLDKWTLIHLNGSDKNVTLHVVKIHKNVTFLLIQAHSFREPVTLATVRNPRFGQYVTSTDPGMTSLLKPGEEKMTWYLDSKSPKSNVTVWVVVTSHDKDDPVPGGCNQEFPLKYDPNIHLSKAPNIARMEYQYGNRGFQRLEPSQHTPDCESQWDILTYDLYIHYMSSTNPNAPEHFLALQHMSRPGDIVKYGRRMVSHKRGRGVMPRTDFMAYPGQGVIYNVIVTQKQGHLVRTSAYVPSAWYACNLIPDKPDSCDTLDDRSHPYKAISTTVAVLGVLLMFSGHRFLKCNMFTFGLLSFTLTSYIVMRIAASHAEPMNLFWFSVLVGVLGGVLWTMFWWYVGVPVLSVLLIGLSAGYLLASVVFYTPLDSIYIFRLDYNYGIIFVCWMLLFNALSLPWPKKVSVLSSSLVGSYSVVFAAGLYVKSSVPYILVNSIRKAVIPGFIQAVPTKPFFVTDIVLCVTWLILFILSSVVQFSTTREDPDFPPCPRAERLYDRRHLFLAEESANTADREGLLSQVSYPSYRSTDARVLRDFDENLSPGASFSPTMGAEINNRPLSGNDIA